MEFFTNSKALLYYKFTFVQPGLESARRRWCGTLPALSGSR